MADVFSERGKLHSGASVFMIRVLVVDDSTFMRHALVSLLEQDPEIKVPVRHATAGGSAESRRAGRDVMTLDVEMPRLDGLATLQELMKTHPMPVLMVSSLTESGAESTLKAMEYGALDFILKTMSNDRDCFGDELRRKVKAIARKKTIVKLKYRRINISCNLLPIAANLRNPRTMSRRPATDRAIWWSSAFPRADRRSCRSSFRPAR